MEELTDWLRKTANLDDDVQLPEIPEELRPILEALRSRIKQTENELAFLKASVNAMPNPIFIKDQQLRFVFFNNAYRNFFGLKDDTYIGKQVLDLTYLPEEERVRYHAEDSELVRNLSVLQYEAQYNIARGDVSESLYWCRGFEVPETKARGLVGEIVDISQEKKTQRDLARSMNALELLMRDAKAASKTDPGTGLYNRSVLTSEVPTLIRETTARNQTVCMLVMDIDYFKNINDSWGHLYGDEVLRHLAVILQRSFRQSDIIIRYGGDEFIVFLPGTKLNHAREVAERLCATVRSQLLLPNGKNATLSIGAAEMRPDEELLDLIARADEALYLSKQAGRDRVST